MASIQGAISAEVESNNINGFGTPATNYSCTYVRNNVSGQDMQSIKFDNNSIEGCGEYGLKVIDNGSAVIDYLEFDNNSMSAGGSMDVAAYIDPLAVITTLVHTGNTCTGMTSCF